MIAFFIGYTDIFLYVPVIINPENPVSDTKNPVSEPLSLLMKGVGLPDAFCTSML
jgi:hypothetical protein